MTVAKQRETEVVQDGLHRGLVLPLASCGKSRYVGTQELPSGRWRATFFDTTAGKKQSLGAFDSEQEAAIAAARARRAQQEAGAIESATTQRDGPKGVCPPGCELIAPPCVRALLAWQYGMPAETTRPQISCRCAPLG